MRTLVAGALCVLAAAQTLSVAPAGTAPVDDFEDLAGWTALPADGVKLEIAADTGVRGNAMRLDFDFVTGGGWAVARKELALDLPENYVFSFHIRGQAPPNHFEFKLVDSTGANVWWSVRRDVPYTADWETWQIKKRHIRFAWGPRGGGDIAHVAAIEIAITAGPGGTGSVWIDELELRALPAPDDTPQSPVATASTARPQHDAARSLDGDAQTSWWCAAEDAFPTLDLDLVAFREYGGLILDWEPDKHAIDYDVEVSEDGSTWQVARAVRSSNGGRDYIYMPETESRFVRIRALRFANGVGVALREVAIQALEWSVSREAFFQAVARDAPRGSYPRGMSGEQAYWTVVGVDGDKREALLGEDGALETGPGRFSIEPFLFEDDRLATWSEAQITQSLEDGFLPVPTVHWDLDALKLAVTAFATGQAGQSSVIVRYRVRNDSASERRATLYLAVRPFQVNPPTQTLNIMGGTAPIREIAQAGRTLHVNGERAVVCLTPPEAFGALTFDAGDAVVDFLRRGQLPPHASAQDAFEAASGALAFALDLAPGGEREVAVAVPLYATSPLPAPRNAQATRRWLVRELERTRTAWREKLGRIDIRVPEEAAHVVQSLRAQLAYILINRAGPALQPGTRAYARSWIRDGALTSWALLRLGHTEAARQFLEWYAPHQFANGKIPCVVDARGPDPVPEHDSSGEFVFLVAELYRYTHDRELAERLWPRALRAVAYLDSLRHERRTPEYEEPGKQMYYGLLPPSISHEGYAAEPMHSYWDDFFALRGFSDAVFLAGIVHDVGARKRLESIREEFALELVASIARAMRHHDIDYIPGCADLGDFDATSTTIALAPVDVQHRLPPAALQRTFERYYDFARQRADGAPWEAFTPYEVRNIGAFVRLGWRERAHELLEYFLAHQRPVGWRQWPEVVRHEERDAAFLGDLPHTWVGSDYVRSVLDLFAYEREEDDALVLGAGVPTKWLHGSGIELRDLRTRFGPLSYAMWLDDDHVQVRIDAGPRVPSGGIVVITPNDQAVVRELPATLQLAP
jgi:hypothetical protein